MEFRESTIATRCSVQIYTAFIPQTLFLISRPDTRRVLSTSANVASQHSRRRHHTNIETVKVLEIKSDGILHKVTYQILYSLRAQVAKFAVDLCLVFVDSCSVFIDVFIKVT